MDLNGRPVRCFIAVAEDGSFSRAARRMHMSQPALSAQIRAFERQLGFDVFRRNSRHVDLTPEGRQFLAAARRFVAETSIFNQAARDIRINEIRIGAAVETALIPERTSLIERFIEKYPLLQLQILDGNQLTHWSSLLKRDLDLAIIIEATKASSLEDGTSANFERMVLCQRRIQMVVPSNSPLAMQPAITLANLKEVHIVLPHMLGDRVDTSELAGILNAAGVQLIRPPEGNSFAIEQFAAKHRVCAISLGWINTSAINRNESVYRSVSELDFSTALTLVRARAEHRPGARQFWNSAALQCNSVGGPTNIGERVFAAHDYVNIGGTLPLRVRNVAAHG